MLPGPKEAAGAMDQETRPSISVLVPAYNEAGIIQANLGRLCEYLDRSADRWRWELVVVDDGSEDDTVALAEALAATRENVRILRHPRNFRLGQTLRYGFGQCRGQYIVVLDMDMTYDPEHIERLVERIHTTPAKIVVASPYMKGGRTSNVPAMRVFFSRWGNRFLALTARGMNLSGNLSTFTGMVRAYDAMFLRSLNLKSMGMEINIEIIYKSLILGASIDEIPAHLDWTGQRATGSIRSSSKRIGRGILTSLLAAFIIRPFAFFIVPGLLLGLVSLYVLVWLSIHVVTHLREVAGSGGNFDQVLSESLALAFQQSPHGFIVGGITLMLSVQLISLGVLALQAKQYFEELFTSETRAYAQGLRVEDKLDRILAELDAPRSEG